MVYRRSLDIDDMIYGESETIISERYAAPLYVW